MDLLLNIAKTKVMVVDNTPINVNIVLTENVEGYVYLGQHYSLKEKIKDKEIQRGIMARWAAYAKHRDIFRSNLAICVLPAMTYGAETWTLTKQAQNKLAAARTEGHEHQHLVGEMTKVINIISNVRKIKWSLAGHISRLKDDRCMLCVVTWRPDDKRDQPSSGETTWTNIEATQSG